MKLFKDTFVYILSGMMLLGGTTACSDFIDIDPENKVPEKGVDFTKTENMYQPVTGAYSAVRSPGMHWGHALLLFTRDGDMWSGRTDDQGDAATFGRHYNYNNGFWLLDEIWKNYYNIIRTCNSALESLDGYSQYIEPGSANYTKYEQYCGEVRFIRAWAYYTLVTNFGPIVLYTDNLQTSFRRSTVEKVYNHILDEDLKYAMAKLPRIRPNQAEHPGAVTAFTAEMLAAKIQMLKGNWSEVETLTQDIIDKGNFELYNDFYQLFKIPGKLCDESLFECQVTDFGNGSGEYVGVDVWFEFQGTTIRGTVNGENKEMGGWNFLGYEKDFVNWAKARGEGVRLETSVLEGGTQTREGWTISQSGNEDVTTNYHNGKAYVPYEQFTLPRQQYGQNNNVRIFRYAEVLLMNSEAKIRNGKDGDYGYNEVRKRAGMSQKTGATLQDVMDERRMELCGEWCNRYVDLVRTGEAATILGPKGWTVEKTYWPVPFNQAENSPELKLEPIE